MNSNNRTPIIFLLIFLSTLIASCYSNQSTASDQLIPGDPHLVVETLTPTPDPLIAGKLTIHREGIVTGGDGGNFEVSGTLPLQLLYRESAFEGDDLIETEGPGTGMITMFGHGAESSGQINSVWEVTFKVRGILHPAPKCDVELWIEEYWGDEVTATMIVNGEQVIMTMAFVDLIPFTDMNMGSGHLIIPKSQTELTEYVGQPHIDWINTYRIELQPLTKFEGCNN
jgi:hypothetical protein